jgi:anti-sigma factor RsiW
MTCRESTGFLLDYLSGELPPDTLAEFERHLDRCANCRAFLSQYRTTILAAKRTADPPVDLPEELVQAIVSALGKL